MPKSERGRWSASISLYGLAMGTSFIWQYWVETIMMILTRSLDLAARNSHQNAHVPKLVAALEPQPPRGPQTIRLNRCLPISQGFYAPAKERQGLELLVVRGVNTKDRCEACDIAKGEATLYYHKGLRRTLWARDVNYYKRNKHPRIFFVAGDWPITVSRVERRKEGYANSMIFVSRSAGGSMTLIGGVAD